MKLRGQRNPAPDLQVYVFLSKAGLERPFSPAWSQKVIRFSDDFEWGFARQGSKQLALALLLEVTGDVDVALTCYHDFDRIGQPQQTQLLQNFPNPFNPETWIPYQLEQSGAVSFEIYDTAGRMVRLLDLGFKGQGFYMTRSTAAYWDGRNDFGEAVASGVYFYQLKAGDYTALCRMVIVK